MYKLGTIDTTPQLDPWHRDTGGETLTVLAIDPSTRTVTITQESDDNATSSDQWHGLIIARTLATRPDEAQAIAELTDSYLVERVIAGWSSDYTDQSNLEGSLDDDACNALDELIDDLEACDPNPMSMTSVTDYYADLSDDDFLITPATTDAEIITLAGKLMTDALDATVILTGDLVDYLTRRRNDLHDD